MIKMRMMRRMMISLCDHRRRKAKGDNSCLLEFAAALNLLQNTIPTNYNIINITIRNAHMYRTLYLHLVSYMLRVI